MGVLSHLEPKAVFHYFEAISNIPRGSGNEKAVSDFVVDFAKARGLYCRQDSANNVIIKKPGTVGYENAPAVILQGHLDMVCEKNNDTIHDFLKDSLDLYIDGDFIGARGTTLGADNGAAVAMELALLDAQDIAHPPIECLFTTDEEVGMVGAKVLDPYDLDGRMLINLDSEEEGNLLVSCSGGRRVVITLPVEREAAPAFGKPYIICISGLKGGHSGTDIHIGRANANKLMGRVLSILEDTFAYRLISIDGGLMENAIVREASATIWIRPEDEKGVLEALKAFETTLYNEYSQQDGALSLSFAPLSEEVQQVMTKETSDKIKNILLLIPYGVEHRMSSMPDMVETSSNIGVVRTEENAVLFCSDTRSSVASRKEALLDKLRALAKLSGAKYEDMNDYPAWTFRAESPLLELFKKTYQEIYGKEAKVTSIHAGLECGILGEKISGLDMISIGPDMIGIHSPQERLSISSMKRTWEFLLEVLKRLK